MIEPLLSFTVYGNPAPQGSKTPWMTEQVKGVYAWRDKVRGGALQAWRSNPLIDVPVALVATFTTQPPKTIPKIRDGHASAKPDLDKLVRAVGDALTQTRKSPGVLKEDSLIIHITAAKTYPYDRRFPDALAEPGAVIHIYPASDYR